MTTIDPTARIEDGAVIGEGTSVGPYCIIGPHVVIGANCRLIAHVHITAQTTIGDAGYIHSAFRAYNDQCGRSKVDSRRSKASRDTTAFRHTGIRRSTLVLRFIRSGFRPSTFDFRRV